MIKKSIIGLIAIIAAIGLVFAAYGNDDKSNSKETPANIVKQDSTVKNSVSSHTELISEKKAMSIAQKYIEEPGAKAGKPKLSKIDGNSVYTVPVLLKGETVGEIYINAKTGKNLGGAGGIA